jgi:hypothetical protein
MKENTGKRKQKERREYVRKEVNEFSGGEEVKMKKWQ